MRIPDRVWTRTVAPDDTVDPLTLELARDSHLRVTNGTAEDAYINQLRATSRRQAERWMKRLLFTQTHQFTQGGFPSCGEAIVIDRSPLQSVVSITYVDPDGVTQTFGGTSPEPYIVLNPTLESNDLASIALAYNEQWPATRAQPNAVTVTVVLGYPNAGSPAVASMPDDITSGRLLMIGELYKQRTESVQNVRNDPAILRARDLWQHHRVYR